MKPESAKDNTSGGKDGQTIPRRTGTARIRAFFMALLITAAFFAGVHIYASAKAEKKSDAYGCWTSEVKYKAGRIMRDQLDKNTILLLGSSELQHQKSTPYHPGSIFEGQDKKLLLVGAGYYQSLFHTTLVAALEPEMVNRKAVLIVAPQWFRKSGVKAEAFASRFSEENFVEMLKNPDLSDETKRYITDRTKKLLKVDPKERRRILQYEEQYLGSGREPDRGTKVFQAFMEEKTLCNVMLRLGAYELTSSRKKESTVQAADNPSQTCAALAQRGEVREPDFVSLRASAARDGEEACGGNPFFVKKSYYDSYIVKVMDQVKDEGIKTGYSVSPEYDDFECFLKACSEMEIEPMVVITPVNGYWYDWIGFDSDAREDYYSQVRALCEKYGARIADFSDREYEEYFMEDTIHIGWKGWVDVSEAVYRFAEE